jgi:hypothetical protein
MKHAVLRIRIGFNGDPAFFVNADPDTDPDKKLEKFTAGKNFYFFYQILQFSYPPRPP